MALYRAKRYGLAVEEFRRALQENPQNANTACMLAMSLSFNGQHSAATGAGQATVEMSPNNGFSHHVLAVALARTPGELGLRWAKWRHSSVRAKRYRRNLERARLCSAEATRLEPHNADYLRLAGGIAFDLNKRDEALRLAERGLAVQPDHVGCGNLRAHTLRVMGKREDAKQAVGQVLSVAPESPAALENRAWLLLQEGRPGEARAGFAESLRLDPHRSSSQSGLRLATLQSSGMLAPLSRGLYAVQRRIGKRLTKLLLMYAVTFGVGLLLVKTGARAVTAEICEAAVFTGFVALRIYAVRRRRSR